MPVVLLQGNALDAWNDALACDPVSAYGGVIATNIVDDENVAEIDKVFFEIIIAPDYSEPALEILKQKKNRIILQRKIFELQLNTLTGHCLMVFYGRTGI
jgi:phosphoribosylaminoimidazolecarboxamide formyltransferase / IMP cyclohydrolase